MNRRAFAFAALILAGHVTTAPAQLFGTLRWQLQPYCNILALSVSYQREVYTLVGTDDRCGAAQAASARGVAFLNRDGTIGVGLTSVAPGGIAIHLDATVTISSLSGTWRDSSGNLGTLSPTSASRNSGARRLEVAPGLFANGTVTSAQLAADAVTAADLAANAVSSRHVVDGSLTGADVAPASITSTALAPNAVGAGQITSNAVDGTAIADDSLTGMDLAPNSITETKVQAGSLTRADVGDLPRLWVVEASLIPIPAAINSAFVVSAITVAAPTAGRVMLTASGYISGHGEDMCAFSDTTSMGVVTYWFLLPYYYVAVNVTPLALTNTFSVAAGSSTTFRLICKMPRGDPRARLEIRDLTMTALFVPGS